MKSHKAVVVVGMICFGFLPIFAQLPDSLWTKTYGGSDRDVSFSVQQTSDGGYIVTGYTESYGAGNSDVWLLKTDANGDTIWTKTYGWLYDDYGGSVQQTYDGGYIVAGRTGDYPYEDLLLIKTDANGDTIWTKRYGGSNWDGGVAVHQLPDSGYIVAGYTQSASPEGGWLLRTDANGDTLWTKIYSGCYIFSLALTSDGGYVLSGNVCLNGYDLWIAKTDANGDTLWTKVYGDFLDDEYGYSVKQTSDGGYIVGGYTVLFGDGYSDVYIVKTDSLGNAQWIRNYGGISEAEHGYDVIENDDGDYVIVGYDDPGIYFLKLNTSGDSLCARAYGGTSGHSIEQATDGGYIMAGGIYRSDDFNIYLVKTESDIGIEEQPDDKVSYLTIPGLVYGDILKIIGLNKDADVRVFDILGREVLNQTATPDKSYITLNNLKSGVYFLIMKGEKPRFSKFALIK